MPSISQTPPDEQPAHPGTDQFAWTLPFPDDGARRAAWRHMMLRDEGLARMVLPNRHQIAPGVWRSGQPNPRQLARFAGRGGKTVISLRNGRNHGSMPLEIEACHRLGLAFHVLPFRSRRLPESDEIHAFDALIRSVEKPILFHCKSGADRAGFAAALYLMLAEDRPAEEAMRQLSLRYGHLKHARTGVLDAFFETYLRDTGGRRPLLDWVDDGYDPKAIEAAFQPQPFSRWLADRLLERE